MQQAALSLVQEDSRLSRGQVDEDELIAESRQLDDESQGRDSLSDLEPSSSYNNASSKSAKSPRGFQFSTRTPNVLSTDYHATDSAASRRAKQRRYWRRALVNLFFIASWYLFSTLISVYNKWMFSPQHFNFGYPLFVTTFHMMVQFILSGVALAVMPRFRPKQQPTMKEYSSKAGPCGIATGLDIGLSNLSLKTITLSFYTMCKSSSLGFVLLFAFLFKLEQPTWRLVGIISIITVGLILMVSGETQFSLIGMTEVLAASAMGGLRWALTQKLLDKETMGLNNPFATLFWLAPFMAVTLAVCSLLTEGPVAIFASDKFWGGFWACLRTGSLILFPGVLAFCMTTSEFALIQRTSVVTLSVAGIFKEVSTILVSMAIFHDELTAINISGLVTTLVGIALYNYMKFRDSTYISHEAERRKSGFAPVSNGQGPYGDSAHSRSQGHLGHLPIYNPATESALFLAEANDDMELQHTIGDYDDDDTSDKQRDSIHKEHVEELQVAGLKEALSKDGELMELDREEAELEQAMQRR